MQPESTHQEAVSAEFVIATHESSPPMAETPSGNSQNPTLQSDSISLQGDDLSKSALQKKHHSKPTQPEPNREAHWRAIIQKRLQSGLSIREFCRQQKLSTSIFHRWKRKIATQDGRPLNGKSNKNTVSKQNKNVTSKPTFIPIAIDSTPTLQPQIEQPQVEILYASGTIVRIASGCDEKTISVILKAMENEAC